MHFEKFMESIDPVKDWEDHLEKARTVTERKDESLISDPVHQARVAVAKAFSVQRNAQTHVNHPVS